jgi:hypothetical protein
MEEKWEKAFHTPGEKVLLGLDVVCDACEKDWTSSEVSGGFLFGAYAYCPDCAEKGLKQVKEYGEEKYLKGFCPKDMSFADFVCEMRGPDAGITVTVGWPEGWNK